MNIKIINTLKNLNKKAIKNGDVPVSCVVLKDDKIISRAYNQRVYKKNPLYHAEILAIMKASKKLGTWNLSDCELYCTLLPCKMCKEAINNAHIKKVYYILDNNKEINSKLEINKININNYKYFEKELKTFFVDKR